MVGKPYTGKPSVRFDEGELEIGPSDTTPVLYSTVTNNLTARYCSASQHSPKKRVFLLIGNWGQVLNLELRRADMIN